MRPWRRVATEDFGKGSREYVRGQESIAWQLEPGLIGVVGPYATASDIQTSVSALDNAVGRADRDVFVVTDMRRVRLDGPRPEVAKAITVDFEPRIQALARRVKKQAALVADDWTRPFWMGINRVHAVPWAWEVFTEPTALWQWLERSREDGAEIEGAVAELLGESQVCASLATLLERTPELDIDAAAHSLGLSPRSLQRELARAGASFSEVRARARDARACALLATTSMKIEAIATEVGFTSVAHFGAWFRRRRGLTPVAFRETLRKLTG